MKLTTKGHYAIRAMIDIAMHSAKSKEPLSLREISHNQNIPLPFLEQIAIKLRKAVLVKSTRGPAGGYILSKDKKIISIADIIEAVEGPINIAPNIEHNYEVTDKLWQKLNLSILNALKSISLEDLYYDTISFVASKKDESYVQ